MGTKLFTGDTPRCSSSSASRTTIPRFVLPSLTTWCAFCGADHLCVLLAHVCAAQNELGVLEFIHALVETMDKYFESVVRSQLRLALCAAPVMRH